MLTSSRLPGGTCSICTPYGCWARSSSGATSLFRRRPSPFVFRLATPRRLRAPNTGTCLPSVPMRILSLRSRAGGGYSEIRPWIAFGDLEALRFPGHGRTRCVCDLLRIRRGSRHRRRTPRDRTISEDASHRRENAASRYGTGWLCAGDRRRARGGPARRVDVESRRPGPCAVSRGRRHRVAAAGQRRRWSRAIRQAARASSHYGTGMLRRRRAGVCVDHGRRHRSPANRRQRGSPPRRYGRFSIGFARRWSP